jgi:hypothetical protein
MKVVRFTVRGRGTFPVDMLRYDCCYPTSSDGACSILTHYTDSEYNKERKVELSMVVEHKNQRPTEARWISFGWTVENVMFYK